LKRAQRTAPPPTPATGEFTAARGVKTPNAELGNGTDAALERKGFSALGRIFRGEIWEHAPAVAMGKGYVNENQPFDIRTAQYLKPPFRAIKNPTKRKVVVRAGVQTLKTFFTEKSAGYLADQEPDDMVLYDCDLEAARDHAKSRLGPFLKSIPGLANQIEEIADRHDVSTKEFYLPGMTLRIWPLNESSTQRITLRYVIIHDAFLSKRTGLIGHAIARTTQHGHDKKIIIESQGSEEGDNFDAQFMETDQGTVFVKCAVCGLGQMFVHERFRAPDFPIAPPLLVPSLDHGAWIEHHRPLLARKWSGFQRGPDELVLLPDGRYNAEAIKKLTYYECFYCGGHWPDTPGVRLALDESSYYVSQNPGANAEYAGFHWPAWINQRVKWGDVLLQLLNARRADKELGNRDDFKLWWQKVAGLTWRDDVGSFTGRISDAVYDPKAPMPYQAMVFGLIDVQENLEHFWVQIWAVDKRANVRMLHREHVRSGLFMRQAGNQEKPEGEIPPTSVEMSAMERVEGLMAEWKVPVNCVGVDGGHEFERVLEWAAKNRYVGPVVGKNGHVTENAVLTWRVLTGSRLHEFRWKDGRRKRFDQGFKGLGNRYPVKVSHEGQDLVVYVLQNNISALRYADFARRFRDQENAPRMEVLPAIAAQTGPESFNEQMYSEYRTTEKNKPIWKKKTSGAANHDWDLFKMLLAMMDMRGLLSLDNDPLDDKDDNLAKPVPIGGKPEAEILLGGREGGKAPAPEPAGIKFLLPGEEQ
jgi:phage terminase large subunit GpA